MNLRCSFSLPVIGRILAVLDEHSPGLNRTNLAGKTGLNYGTCIRYMDFLSMLRWVRISEEHGGLISLTPTGKEFMPLLLHEIEEGDPDIAAPGFTYSQSALPVTHRSSRDDRNDSVLDGHRRMDGICANQSYFDGLSKCPGNIMIVEDEQDVLLTFKVYLTQLGLNVYDFSDARMALQQFKAGLYRQIDLIVSDIRMDSINGIQLYRELKSIAPNTRIVFVSALDAAPELVSALPGFKKEDLIAKPVDQDTFTRTIQTILVQERKKSASSGNTGNPLGRESMLTRFAD